MTLARLRSSTLFRNANLLALMGMLLLAMMPVLHHPAASPTTAPICHISMKDVGGKGDPHTPAKPACPICQTMGSLNHGFVTPTVIGLALQPSGAVPTVITHYTARGYTTPTVAWPRAPPSFA